ncbi:MAG: acylphosphatase [Planctomycetes bacterium]|nr:acylphosphatase [Planctomycetota bacterium]
MPPLRLELRFHGRVQGVGFRARAKNAAERFGVAGWVRNEADGSVACVAEGEDTAVREFHKALSTEMSRYIENIEAVDARPRGDFSSFTVEYQH